MLISNFNCGCEVRRMSYGKYLVGLGLALVVLASLSAGVTLGAQWLNYAGKAAAMGWSPGNGMMGKGWQNLDDGMMGNIGGMMGKGKCYCPCMASFNGAIEITGKVIGKIDERHVIVVQGDDGKTYNVTIKGVYVRTIDGTLVYGGWIYHDLIEVGDSVAVVGVGNKALKALSIQVDDVTFQNPKYYEFVKHSGE